MISKNLITSSLMSLALLIAACPVTAGDGMQGQDDPQGGAHGVMSGKAMSN